MTELQIQKRELPEEARKQIRRFRAASKADETKRALAKNWGAFQEWCRLENLTALPCSPETLEAYLVSLAERGLKAASIDQAKWGVDARHRMAGLPLPGSSEKVRVIMAGIKRALGSRQHRKEALTFDHLRQITFSENLAGKRNKALLLIGFAGGLRRSELASLQAENVVQTDAGVRLFLAKSKTDQEGSGSWVEIVRANSPTCCPVEALKEWLAASGVRHGALFRSVNRWGGLGNSLSPMAIAQLVKDAAFACGLDPRLFGGHSLRAGCATYLLEHGVPLNVVAKQGRWKKADTVLRYDRNATTDALKGIY